MYLFNRLTAIVLTAVLLGPMLPLEAKTKKGDKFLAEGRVHEQKKEWDAALEAYDKALSEDPADIVYQMASTKVHFQAAQSHIDKGLKLRSAGQLGEALLELQKAYAINPGSAAAVQEIRRTTDMIERERKRVEETGKESTPKERAMTEGEKAKKETEDRISSILPVPELRPIDQNPIHLRMNGSAKLLFETVAKVAGLNVLWDPEYQPQVRGNIPVEFENSTLDEALDYLAVITKSYWKPLSPNTIFITMDNPNKRRDYEEQVAKVFYLANVNTPQELQEIVNAVRSVADIQRFFPYNAQNAIIAKGSADQVALAEKILHDLDKPKSEVVVDIIVMEASSVYSRQLTAALAPTGINVGANFTPRGGLKVVTDATTTPTTPTTDANGNPVTTPAHHDQHRLRQFRPVVQSGPAVHGGFFHHHPGRPAAARAERCQYEGAAIAATARRGQCEGDAEDRRPPAHRNRQFPAGHRRRGHQSAGQHAVHLHRCRRQRGNHAARA